MEDSSTNTDCDIKLDQSYHRRTIVNVVEEMEHT